MSSVCLVQQPLHGLHTHHVNRERQAKQEQPKIQMERVREHVLMGVVEPAAGERGPHPLAQDIQRLRAHVMLVEHNTHTRPPPSKPHAHVRPPATTCLHRGAHPAAIYLQRARSIRAHHL